MTARKLLIGSMILAAGCVVVMAQTPNLNGIQTPYGNLPSPVHVAGKSYGRGAVAYGPVGTPLWISGSNLGEGGTVQFVPYKNGAVDQNAPIVSITGTWQASIISLTVPAGALTGVVQVVVGGTTSNAVPFIVTPGQYASSCPSGPTSSQLQIATSSLDEGAVGKSYSETLSATGGTQPYTWSVASGTLPTGLSLNPSTGVLSGTPTAAASQVSLTFEVTDSSSPQLSNQAVLDLTIEPQLLTASAVYSYAAIYDGDGNVTQYSDTVMGEWQFTYDAFDRLESGAAIANGIGAQKYTGQNLCWAYDAVGNRTAQGMQTSACPSQESTVTPTQSYNANNQISSGLVGYDAAGEITADANSGNTYMYDAEGRVCAVKNAAIPGMPTYTGYLYDADGNRVAKGTIASMSCDPQTSGFQITENYVLGAAGEELSMLDGNNNWQRTNVYAGGRLVGTYDANGLHYHLEDPLGTRRMQLSGNTSTVGQPEWDIQSLPFGDQLNSSPDQYAPTSGDDSTPLYFTGKERDTESGNDYFGARYYASSMGRFLSPDWSAKEEPVPYAKLDNPQSLNLYAYALNNPLKNTDPDGHETEAEKQAKIAAAAAAQKGSNAYDINKTNVSNMQIFKNGSDKCNEFVSDTVKSADGTRPVVDGTGKIPTAAQFADPNVKITGLSAPEPMSNAKPGDVIAQDHGAGANGNEEGHVGIVVGLPHDGQPGQTASANANQGGQVTVNDWGFRSPTANPNNGERNGASSPAPVVRHPLGDQQ